jgi:hypothetical protein
MTDDFPYDVRIPLKTTNIFDIDGRVQEVTDIREWIDAQVHWADDQYDMKYLAGHFALHIWFKQEKYATMCRLRWLS